MRTGFKETAVPRLALRYFRRMAFFTVPISFCLFGAFFGGLSQGLARASSPDECSRAWAVDQVGAKSFKIIGLGLSSLQDSKLAADEARAAAFKDISLQLQSSIKSRSEVKETQSDSGFSGSSILTSETEDLVGLKAVKNGKRSAENISHCEVYEFNVQGAYEDQSSKLSVIQEKIDQVEELGNEQLWIDVIREYPKVRPLVSSHAATIKRADLFKAFLNVPGPGWDERLNRSLSQLEELDKKARAKLVFIFPKNQFEEVVEEVKGMVSNSGAKVGDDPSEVGSGSQGIQVTLKRIGSSRKARTKLGLTMSRNVSIVLTDMKTKQRLASSNGLSLVGTSANDDEAEALANADRQLVGALADAIRNIAPALLQD